MILDSLINFSGSISAAGAMTGQLVSSNSTLSANTVDVGASGSESLEGAQILIHILAAPATCTDVAFQLVQADDAALTSNLQVLKSTGAIPIASLPAGTRLTLQYGKLPPAAKRYIGLRYVSTGATITAMSVFAAAAADSASRARIFNAGTTVL